ncbi:MAG: glycoside hydrolase family 3 C-terminal domain-containing protein [Lachnospiraceae bacterium]|nr:glycoside hydrolase family 3 C-terminal domain-containing protein [Lachnospiraceae bacterium]
MEEQKEWTGYSMKNIREDNSGPNRIDKAQQRLRRMQSRIRRYRRNSVTGIVLAAVLLASVFAGVRVTSDNEQAIRLALGQSNYAPAGEEGPQYFETEYEDAAELRTDSTELAKKIQREGIVLLRNADEVLPLRKGAMISVFGKGSVTPVYCDESAAASSVTLKDALEAEKIRVNEKLWNFTQRGGRNSFSGSVEKSMEEYSEAALVVISRGSGSADLYEPAFAEAEAEESGDPVMTGAKALQLTQEEKELLSYVKERFDQVIVVLNTENPIEMGFVEEYGIDGCLWTGALGINGMTAVAEVLSGSVNPSGGLPDTFVYNSLNAPAAANLGDYQIRNSNVKFGDRYLVYAEGIYVGYRYYETRYEDTVLGRSSRSAFDYDREVAFPFGYGLSYTDFELQDMTMEQGKKGYEVSVNVLNTGDRAGREIVQFYIQKPYSQYAEKNGMEIPSVELVAYVKTKELEPGESARVKIVLGEESFKSFDAAGRGTYIIDGGTYLVTAAQDAHRAVNNILMYKMKGGSGAFSGNGDGGLVETVDLVRDNSTFAVSSQTGGDIGRVFREADPAAYDSDYRQLTRSLWGSTWPVTWNGGSYSAPASFQELLKVSSKEDSKAGAPVYNKAHGEKNAGLAALRETAFDDYRWGALLDQLTWRETYSLVRKGGGLVNEVISCISPQALISEEKIGYPSATVIAATWNTELVLQMGKMIGEEALHAGFTFWKIPSLNLHRTAMGGGNSSSFSEDSYLTGSMAAAICRGVSGKGVIPVLGRMVLADQETNYTGVVVMAGEQALRELYLRPFEIALRDGGSGMKAVMAGMNRVGPRWCGGHSGLLTKVLRDEWGFTGIVMTDRITGGTDEYADILEGLEAGTDLWQNTSSNNYKLRGGQLTYGVRARFRTAAGRILQTVSRSNAMNGIGTKTTLEYKSPMWKTLRTVLAGVIIVISAALLWFAFAQSRKAVNLRVKMDQEKRENSRSRRR